MSHITYESFWYEFVKIVPEFRPIYEENLELNGCTINHPIMADFFPFFLKEYTDSIAANNNNRIMHLDIVVRSLAFLEEAMGAIDEEVENLISVSFLEGFPPEKSYPGLRKLMGPHLRRELDVYKL